MSGNEAHEACCFRTYGTTRRCVQRKRKANDSRSFLLLRSVCSVQEHNRGRLASQGTKQHSNYYTVGNRFLWSCRLFQRPNCTLDVTAHPCIVRITQVFSEEETTERVDVIPSSPTKPEKFNGVSAQK